MKNEKLINQDCYTTNNKKWHNFKKLKGGPLFPKEGEICHCGKMKIISGVVIRI